MSPYVFTHDNVPVPADELIVPQDGSRKPMVFDRREHPARWVEVKWVEDVSSSNGKPSDALRVIRASELKMRPVEWLLKDRIALRSLTLTAGEGGKGKSAIAAEWAAQATTGNLIGRFKGQPVNVLWVGNEDGREDVIGPRLKMAEADLDRVFFLTTASTSLVDEVNVVADIDKIRATCREHEAKLLVVDPLVEYLPGSTDSHNDMSVRQALRPMRSMAAELDISILALVHFNKAGTPEVAARIAASAGFRNASRSVLIVADHPDDEGWRILFQNKSNWGPEERRGRAYRVEGVEVTDTDGIPILDYEGNPFTTAKIRWGEEIDLDPNSLPDTRGEREAPKRNSAEDMLRTLLGEQPWLQSDIRIQARLEDIGWITVRRAAEELGVEKRQIPVPGKQGPGPSWWALPGTDWDDCEWLFTPSVSPDEQPFKTPKDAGQGDSPSPKNEWLLTSTGEKGDVGNHSPHPNPELSDSHDRGLRLVQDAFRAEIIRDGPR